MVDVTQVGEGALTESGYRSEVRSVLQEQLGRGSVEDYLHAVVQHAPRVVGPDVAYSLSVLWGDQVVTVAATDDGARRADQVEYDLSDGPCVEALRVGTAFVSDDLQSESRWPSWTAAALDLGYRSAVGVATPPDEEVNLALNCFANRPGAFDDGMVERARWFTWEVAATLLLARRLAEQARLVDQLQQALAGRPVIDQALGVLMGQERCTRDEAFAVLRRASQGRNVKLREIAAEIVTHVTGHPPAAPAPFVPSPGRAPAGRARGRDALSSA